MRSSNRWRAAPAAPIALALLGSAVAPAAAAASPAKAPTVRLALVTGCTRAFWRAVGSGSSVAYTSAGDALYAASLGVSDRVAVQEAAPGGQVLWQGPTLRAVGSIVTFDGGRFAAFTGIAPLRPAEPWYTLAPASLYILRLSDHHLVQVPIDRQASVRLVGAGRFLLANEGFGYGADLASLHLLTVWNEAGQLVSARTVEPSVVLYGSLAIGAGAGRGVALLPVGSATQPASRTNVVEVNPRTGALAASGFLPFGANGGVLPLVGGGLLTYPAPGNGGAITRWRREASGAWRAVWSITLGSGEALASAPAVRPGGAAAAVGVGMGTWIVNLADGTIEARLHGPGRMVPIAAERDGFATLDVRTTPKSATVQTPGLSAFDWSGVRSQQATLPAGPLPQVGVSPLAQVDGTTVAPILGAANVALVPAPGPAQAPTLPSLLESGTLAIGPPQPVAEVALLHDGEALGPGRPLVVTPAEAGKPISLEVEALDAEGQSTPAGSYIPYALSDGGAGGTFEFGTSGGVTQGSQGQTITYVNPKAGSYDLEIEVQPASALTPLFTLPAAVAAGAVFQGELDPPPGSVPQADHVVIRPLAGSDLAFPLSVTPTAAAGGGFAFTYVAGATEGTATFLPVLENASNAVVGYLPDSPSVNVSDVGQPVLGVRHGRLTVAPDQAGTIPIGFVVSPQDGKAALYIAYLGQPVPLPAAAARGKVQGIDANGALGPAVTIPVRSSR